MQVPKHSKWLANVQWDMDEAVYLNERLAVAGLIGFSLIIVQAFIATGLTDPASYISVIASAIAIPLMAAFVFQYRREMSSIPLRLPPSVVIAYCGGIVVDLIGIDAAFWHISWIAGLLSIVSGGVALVVYGNHKESLHSGDKHPLSNLE